jgi:hypothetical protein
MHGSKGCDGKRVDGSFGTTGNNHIGLAALNSMEGICNRLIA